MPTAKLSRFTQELRTSWNTFRRSWRSSFKLVFLPIIPLLFTLPYLIELTDSLQQYHQIPALAGSTIYTFFFALVGTIAFLILAETTRAALFIVYYDNNGIGARRALQVATKRFPKFLYTDILSFIYLVCATLPLLILIFWANNGGRELLFGVGGSIFANIILFVAFFIFAIPLFVLAVWLSFTQIIVATGKNTGFHALTYSTTLVRPLFKRILKRLIAWLLIYVVVSYVVSPLPIASWFVPLVTKLVGAAFLVVLYKEAAGPSLASSPAGTRVRRVVRRSRG